jgi:cytochrome P450 PksS
VETKQANRFDEALWNKKTRGNPQALYEQMREVEPIYCGIGPVSGRNFWFFTRYDDCVTVLKNQIFGKEFYRHLPPEMVAENQGENPEQFNVVSRHMLNLDPPDHTRLRGLVHKAFTPRMIDNLRPRIQQIADDLLDKIEGKDEIDLIEEYSFPLPITVIAEMLGIPVADQDKFRHWTNVLLYSPDEQVNGAAAMEFAMYMHEMIDQRTNDPQVDLITGLLMAEDGGETLHREELLSMIFLLLVAGHETTVNLIANGTLALMQNPDQMQLLRDDPSLIKSAVEEMLRYNGPVETPTMRWSFEDTEMDGKFIQQGDIVLPALLAANRDPAYFENPNVFDIRREPNKHIAFGHGIHFCLGAPLARMEGTIAINTMLARLPKLELNTDIDQLDWNESLLIHGMKALPVRLS